jgi:hypothetical protein
MSPRAFSKLFPLSVTLLALACFHATTAAAADDVLFGAVSSGVSDAVERSLGSRLASVVDAAFPLPTALQGFVTRARTVVLRALYGGGVTTSQQHRVDENVWDRRFHGYGFENDSSIGRELEWSENEIGADGQTIGEDSADEERSKTTRNLRCE